MKPIVSSIHFSPIKSLSFQSINTAIIKKDIGFEDLAIFDKMQVKYINIDSL